MKNPYKQEAGFYRDVLEQIASDKRRTRARVFAESALMFWDTVKKESAKRKKGTPCK